MKQTIASVMTLMFIAVQGHAAGVPTPLKDIRVKVTVNRSGTNFVYKYVVVVPPNNTNKVSAVDIVLDQNAATDDIAMPSGLVQCASFSQNTSSSARTARPSTPVGSTAPNGWSCSYGQKAGRVEATYGWGASATPSLIAPGKSAEFTITSPGLPAIREVLLEGDIDIANLPEEFEQDIEKVKALEKSINMSVKSVGPRVPPRVFDPVAFATYMESLKDQSEQLGWIKGQALKRLRAALSDVQANLDDCEQKKLKKALEEIEKIASKEKDKDLTSEAQILLSSNATYFLSQLPAVAKGRAGKCHKPHHGHHNGHGHGHPGDHGNGKHGH